MQRVENMKTALMADSLRSKAVGFTVDLGVHAGVDEMVDMAGREGRQALVEFLNEAKEAVARN